MHRYKNKHILRNIYKIVRRQNKILELFIPDLKFICYIFFYISVIYSCAHFTF